MLAKIPGLRWPGPLQPREDKEGEGGKGPDVGKLFGIGVLVV